ncbi:MAG: hypothetical protein AUJ55_11715 [Proteobacteria bacterium CG1_02_64_396]|nr:MAG: hypothetical protein AUJ55_11715 [Proteobacteria bacterium CG1_02_64_396]
MQNPERGARLKEERVRLGFSQVEFAKYGDASKGSQILYEKGKAPPADYLEGIASAGCDVLYVLMGRRNGAEGMDRARLTLAIEAVEEGLAMAKKRLDPAAKAQMVMAAYDLLGEATPETGTRGIVRLITAA